MSELTKEHINYIIKDLHKRGLLLDGLKDELIDHVCSIVETEMAKGVRFMDAYTNVLVTFGGNDGLLDTQDKTIESKNNKLTTMFQNYMIIALRSLKKQSFYTFINVAGLAIGVASCLIILLFVIGELSYDKHYKDHERLYRVDVEIKFGDNHLNLAVAPAPMAEALRKDYPEIEATARLWDRGTAIFRRTDESFKEPETIYADSSIFSVFDIPFISGTPKSALIEPWTMVISRKAAEKYFPNETALGQTLISSTGKTWKITGVIEDMPEMAHFRYDFFLSIVSDDYNRDPVWLSNNFATYIKFRKGADPKALEAKLPKMVETYAGPQLAQVIGGEFTLEKFMAGGNKLEYTLMPVTDIHLHSDKIGEMSPTSDITYVYLFATIAGFILVIACINFMNLSTARSANRAKEVGVRKVMGSLRSHLIRQFLTESVLLSVFSFIIALSLAYLALPLFNNLAGKQLSIPFGASYFWILLLAAAMFTGVMAGLYPSFFLSAFRPANVLKGNVSRGAKSRFIRGALVVFQFWISIVLIVGTIAVNRQISYIQNKKIGFEKDQVIVIRDTNALGNQIVAFKDEVLKDNNIKSGTISGFLPVNGTNRSDQTIWPEGKTPTDETMVSTQIWDVDYDYIKTLGMHLKEGRSFSKDFPSDSTAVILNEAALKMLGFGEDVIGKRIQTFASNTPEVKNYLSFNVVGVIEDFHYESLRQNIKPLALFLGPNRGNHVSFSFEAKNTQEIIESINATWKKFGPGLPFDYSFLDEDFGSMYSAELKLGEIFTLFAGLAIIIACLGLFALTAFTAEQRTKEIGVRKVLGASVSGIVMLLSKEFGKLILISFVLAAPVAWYGINWWLESYTYKTEVGVLVYLLAGLAAFAVAWLTMSFQSVRAAMANPVKSLRSE